MGGERGAESFHNWADSAVRTDELLVTAATRGEYARVKEYLEHLATLDQLLCISTQLREDAAKDRH